MKFVCPICETDGSISGKDLVDPVTKATCQKCGTILLVNPDTGNVDAYKSLLKATHASSDVAGARSTDPAPPVLEMRATDTDQAARDWTAIIIVMVVLAGLISAGIYFAG
jgi:transcription elongation factor Elf1